MGWHLDGRVTAVVGTHTHVPTADARVLPGGTAYITDVGMTGARGGVIGVKREQSIAVLRTHMPMRYDAADEDPWLMAVVIRCAATRPCARSRSSRSCGRRRARTQRRAAGTRRGRGRTSGPARAGARSAPRRPARRPRPGRGGGGRRRRPRRARARRPATTLRAGQVVEAPDRERRAAVGLEAERAVVEVRSPSPSATGARARGVTRRERRPRSRAPRARAARPPVGREQRREHERRELRQGGRGAAAAPRARAAPSTSSAAATSSADEASLVFELATSSVNGNVTHA